MVPKGRLGDILVANNLITPQDLEAALKEQKEKGGFLGQILIDKGLVSSADVSRALQEISSGIKGKTELGQMLLAEKLITEDQLKTAIERQKITRKNLDDIFVELGYVTSEQIAETLSCYLGLPFVRLDALTFRQELFSIIPETFIRNYHVVPVSLEQGVLSVAMADPLNIIIVDQIRLISAHKINPMIATKKDILSVIDRYYNLTQKAKQMLADIRLDRLSDETTISRFVDTIIHAGIESRASDIHLEPQYPEMRVRFRIDGILHNIINIPKSIEAFLISRVKVAADMDITEHRRPQDGHMTIKFKDKEYDLRAASSSTVGGEKVVIRILDKAGMLPGLSDVGFAPRDQDMMKALINRPYGIILITGPTGSGKTTTLYALLNQMSNNEE